MKKLLLTLTAVATASLAQAQTVIDFNTSGQFASDFAGFTNWSQSTSGGLGTPATGSVATTGTSQIAVYQPIGYDASSFSGFKVGGYFSYDDTAMTQRPVSFGFTQSASDTYTGSLTNSGNSVRATLVGTGTNAGLIIAQNGTSEDQSSVNVDMTQSTWYYLELTIGGVSGGDFTGVTAELFASDDNGNLGASLKNLNSGGSGYTFTNALTADTDVYAFFGGFSSQNQGVTNFDNFTIVPEPTSAALLIGAAGLLVLRRRR